MEAQEFIEIHVVDEAAARQQDVFLGTVLEEIEIVVEVLEISLAFHLLALRRRQIKQAIVTRARSQSLPERR